MDLMSNFFLFISILAILTSASANPHGPLPPKIKAICDKTSSPDICSNSIAQFHDGKTDIASVLRMQITATMHTIKAAMDESKRLSHEKGVNKCGQLYSSAIDHYKEALRTLALKIPKINVLKTDLDSVKNMISMCDDTMKGNNPLKSMNVLIKKMNGNCFDLNQQFWEQTTHLKNK